MSAFLLMTQDTSLDIDSLLQDVIALAKMTHDTSLDLDMDNYRYQADAWNSRFCLEYFYTVLPKVMDVKLWLIFDHFQSDLGCNSSLS